MALNRNIAERLNALRAQLLAGHQGGAPMSNATKGNEREAFIDAALSNVIAPPFRFGTGDITDSSGAVSGQMDTVIEYGNSISFPSIVKGTPRLYLAEGVCAVVEVKSSLPAQWDQVLKSHAGLAPLRRKFGSSITIGDLPEHVPHFLVAFNGWSTPDTLVEKVNDSGLDGILVLSDPGLYYSRRGNRGSGAASLFVFFAELEELASTLVAARAEYGEYLKS